MNSVILRCNCYSHVIVFDYDKEYDMLFVSVMPPEKTTVWQRIKYVFKGEPSGVAEVVIDKDSLEQLKEYFKSSVL